MLFSALRSRCGKSSAVSILYAGSSLSFNSNWNPSRHQPSRHVCACNLPPLTIRFMKFTSNVRDPLSRDWINFVATRSKVIWFCKSNRAQAAGGRRVMKKPSPVTTSIRLEFLIVFALMTRLARVKRRNECLCREPVKALAPPWLVKEGVFPSKPGIKLDVLIWGTIYGLTVFSKFNPSPCVSTCLPRIET